MNGEQHEERIIKVGSRKSQLALIQTKYVISKLEEIYPTKKFEIVTMMTVGDQILDKPLPKIGEKSLFTKELELALEHSRVDFVVHSLKDMPTDLPDGMAIGAVLEREDPRDVVVFNSKYKGKTLSTLPENSAVGTSSLRRTAQLQRTHPQLKVVNIRGNLNTRLRKLDEGDAYAAIVLAKAGVVRMGWAERIGQVLGSSEGEMMYAVGQGALAVECRENDLGMLALLEPLHHRPTVARILAERSFLNTLGGGCSAPVAVRSSVRGRSLVIAGAVWSLDGAETVGRQMDANLHTDPHIDDGEPPLKCPYREPRLYCGLTTGAMSPRDLAVAEKLGSDLATVLIRLGALEIMSAAKRIIHSTLTTDTLLSPPQQQSQPSSAVVTAN